MIRRRLWLGTLSLWLASFSLAQAQTPWSASAALASLQARSGGRLGVAVLDLATGRRLSQRPQERFAMCSTFKLLVAGAVLARVDAGQETLERRLLIKPSQLLDYSPVTRAHLSDGLSIDALCAAAVEESDNTAGNLLLQSLDGPAAFTRFLRGLGDQMTRLDRYEPDLNSNLAGDPRDTTTPEAMLETTRELVLGSRLSQDSRNRLRGWMQDCKTGLTRLRAAFPSPWKGADKTGTGSRGAANDVAILWPGDGGPPLVVTAFYSDSPKSYEERNAVLAEVGKIVRRWARP